ncbi:hypothetical protein Pelo_904 [Pelomyxa schiedti]|nr:hypothetical protein Pelo_904 [Pelomyxa schiedti]
MRKGIAALQTELQKAGVDEPVCGNVTTVGTWLEGLFTTAVDSLKDESETMSRAAVNDLAQHRYALKAVKDNIERVQPEPSLASGSSQSTHTSSSYANTTRRSPDSPSSSSSSSSSSSESEYDSDTEQRKRHGHYHHRKEKTHGHKVHTPPPKRGRPRKHTI